MIAIRGIDSKIVQELLSLLPPDEEVIRVEREKPPNLEADRYLFCQGVLQPKCIADLTKMEIATSFLANAGCIMRDCEQILQWNDKARICVMGSESGFSGSFDWSYAAAKSGLSTYVERRRLGPDQQLVCIAPSIVIDAAMTEHRQDRDVLSEKEEKHPKRRFLTAMEVARLVHFVFYQDLGYLSNTTIRMHGGLPTV